MYLFILSPPRHGSTILYKLLWTSPNVSTLFIASTWAGEGQFVPAAKRHYPDTYGKRWDPNYKVNWPGVKAAWHKGWDTSKPILCEKTPCDICRAREKGRFFNKFAPVYFICLIRSPYGRKNATKWITCAKYQRNNMQTLGNMISLKYEDMVNDLPGTINRLLNFLPMLEKLNKNVAGVPGLKPTSGGDARRCGPIRDMTAEFTKEEIANRAAELRPHRDLVEFFGYEFEDV